MKHINQSNSISNTCKLKHKHKKLNKLNISKIKGGRQRLKNFKFSLKKDVSIKTVKKKPQEDYIKLYV
jgi:hypothetical protein